MDAHSALILLVETAPPLHSTLAVSSIIPLQPLCHPFFPRQAVAEARNMLEVLSPIVEGWAAAKPWLPEYEVGLAKEKVRGLVGGDMAGKWLECHPEFHPRWQEQ